MESSRENEETSEGAPRSRRRARAENRAHILGALFCAALIGLDLLVYQAAAVIPAIAAVIAWRLTLAGRKTGRWWPPVLGLALALGTNILWLVHYGMIVVSPLLSASIGLETHYFLNRWRAEAVSEKAPSK